MKKSMLILILTALLTSCGIEENLPETAEIPTAQTVTETSDSDEESRTEAETQPSTECEFSNSEVTVTTVKIQSVTVCTTTFVTDMQKEKKSIDPTESRLEKKLKIQRIIKNKVPKIERKNLIFLFKQNRRKLPKIRRLQKQRRRNIGKKHSFRNAVCQTMKRRLKCTIL